MKLTTAAVCFFSLAAGASAFELPAINASALRASRAPQLPAAAGRALEDDMIHGAIPGDAPGYQAKPGSVYAGLAADFAAAGALSAMDLQGWRAGRVYAKDYPDTAAGLLLVGRIDGPCAAEEGAVSLAVLAQGVQPAFYEQLSPSLVPGIAALIDATKKDWTVPEFTSGGARFGKVMPSYDKGYSRFEARKAADGRLLLRHSWKTDLGGYAAAGTDYAVLTKDVTPK